MGTIRIEKLQHGLWNFDTACAQRIFVLLGASKRSA